MGKVSTPLWDELAGKVCNLQAKEVLHLGREDYHSDTAGESYYNRVRDELDDAAQFEDTHKYQHYTCQYSCNDKARDAVLGNNAVYNYNECSGRTSNKEV